MYYLTLITAPTRLLILTYRPFYDLFLKRTGGAVSPHIRITCIPLPEMMQADVDSVVAAASQEMGRELVHEAVGSEIEAELKAPIGSTPDGCREEILAAAQHLRDLGQRVFSPDDIIRRMQAAGTSYPESTIRTHVTSRMCADAPKNHPTTYPDLRRIGYGQYQLKTQVDHESGE